MSSIVYLVRSSSHGVSTALCSNQSSALVISIEDASIPGKVIKTVSGCSFQEGQQLSYGDLLGVLVGTHTVVTL
jgi:hypothetical protein